MTNTSQGFVTFEADGQNEGGQQLNEPVLYNPIEDIANITYSELKQIEYFRRKKLDVEIYGKELKPEDYDIMKYQNLLAYSFIRKKIPAGSKILQVGKGDTTLFQKISNRYQCWILEDPKSLQVQPDENETDVKIISYGNDPKELTNKNFYFDLVLCLSSFNQIPYDPIGIKYFNIIRNLHLITKHKGHRIICFKIVVKNNESVVNPFIYHFFKNYNNQYPLTNYGSPKELSEDTFLFPVQPEKLFSKIIGKEKEKCLSYNIIILSKLNNRAIKLGIHSSRKERERSTVYIFHHLIKCGGTSVHYALQKWFNLEFDQIVEPNEINNFSKTRYNINEFYEDTCIVGHFPQEGAFVHQRYPEIRTNKDWLKTFTFVRDPLKFSISFYYYTFMKGVYEGISLKSHLGFNTNFLSHFLNCTEDNYKEILDQYFFIGITERMQESFDKLAKLTGKRKLKVPFVNKSKRDNQINALTEDYVKEFKERNSLDYKVYEYCLKKFESY